MQCGYKHNSDCDCCSMYNCSRHNSRLHLYFLNVHCSLLPVCCACSSWCHNASTQKPLVLRPGYGMFGDLSVFEHVVNKSLMCLTHMQHMRVPWTDAGCVDLGPDYLFSYFLSPRPSMSCLPCVSLLWFLVALLCALKVCPYNPALKEGFV